MPITSSLRMGTSLGAIDEVEERAAAQTAPCAEACLGGALGAIEQRLVAAGIEQRGVVKLVAAQPAAARAEQAVGSEPRLAIAEREPAHCERGAVVEQPEHRMRHAR